tara:strand:+ start:424 stop:639 length:216 start_codon:yes stop_codon:yes gene_type:complete
VKFNAASRHKYSSLNVYLENKITNALSDILVKRALKVENGHPNELFDANVGNQNNRLNVTTGAVFSFVCRQ